MKEETKTENTQGNGDLAVISNCPDLTHLWNNASIKANKNEISIRAMNKVWGALRELERQGFCKLADSTYD